MNQIAYNLLFLIFLISPVYAQVTFSEVLNDPATSEYHDEFIEIYNLSKETIDLTGWQFSDSSDYDVLIDAGNGMLLPSGRYALILDGSYFDNSTVYDGVIPDSALIITIDNGSFGNGGLSNSNAELLSLIDSSGNIIDSYRYSIGFEPGHSNEKIILDAGNNASNWAEALVSGGTPGQRNSVTPFESDLGLNQNALSWVPTFNLTTDQNINFELTVSNAGLNAFDGPLSVLVFIDSRDDSIFSAGDEIIFESSSQVTIPENEEINVEFTHQFSAAAKYNLVAQIESNLDSNPANNMLFNSLLVLDNSIALHLNEIKFLTEEGEPEWLEIYNSGERTVLFQDWGIADEKDTVIVDSAVFIYPGQFKVFAKNAGLAAQYEIEDSLIVVLSKLPTFNNSGDVVSLLNPFGGLLEQVPYTDDWLEGEDNRKPSLERINVFLDSRVQGSWGPSVSPKNATPGQRNSVTPFKSDLGLNQNALSWAPSFNVTIDQNINFDLTVSNTGLNAFDGPLSVLVFIDSGGDSIFSVGDEIIFEDSSQVAIPENEEIIIEFDYQFSVATKYNLVAQIESSLDSNPVNNMLYNSLQVLDNSITLHLNEIKFLTEEGEPEWVEVYNSGDKAVSLQGWGIADEKDTVFVDSAVFIYPQNYKIIAGKAGLDTLYEIADSQIVVLSNLPTFNNSEDVIYLLNPLGGWLEQVPYTDDWLEGEDNRNPSLERISVFLDSRQQRNWGPSVSVFNATPGKENSLFADPGLQLKSKLEISPNPFSPDNDGHEDHTLIAIKLPANTARIKVEVFDILGRKVRSLRDNSFSGSSTSLVWDGKDNSGRKVRMGIYIVFAQILNDREGVLKELKETVVVARKL